MPTMANLGGSAVLEVSKVNMSPTMNSKEISEAGVLSNYSTSCEGSVVKNASLFDQL